MMHLRRLPDSEASYFDAPAFAGAGAPVFHAFFGRQGGYSGGIFDGLNCGVGSGDEPEDVLKNRRAAAEIMGVDESRLLTLHQIHSEVCVTVREPWTINARPQADAAVTNVPGIALGVLTADCAPVLFYAAGKKTIIGAAHAGWGGALKGVLESTVEAMERLGARAGDIKACIGPCIGKASYEVTQDFAKPFLERNPEDERFFAAGKEGRLMFDLAGYCAGRLADAGVRSVHIKDLDTYFNEEDFYSFRRATHRGEQDYGRQLSAIVIKK